MCYSSRSKVGLHLVQQQNNFWTSKGDQYSGKQNGLFSISAATEGICFEIWVGFFITTQE